MSRGSTHPQTWDLRRVGISRGMGTHPPEHGGWVLTPPEHGTSEGMSNHRLRHGIPWNLVGKQAICFLLECFVITARKRSLGQGNMFTGVCLSTGGACSKGGLVPGGGA